MAYWRASPGWGEPGSVETSVYQRATSSPETW